MPFISKGEFDNQALITEVKVSMSKTELLILLVNYSKRKENQVCNSSSSLKLFISEIATTLAKVKEEEAEEVKEEQV